MRIPSKFTHFGYTHGQINHEKIPHPGYDLNHGPQPDSDVGLPVYAPENGEVVFAGTGNGTWGGLVVIVGQSGLAHRLGHVDKLQVKVGSKVREGQQLAVIGKFPGMSPHLHYDIVRPEVIHTITILTRAQYTRWDFWHASFPNLFHYMYVDPAKYHPDIAARLK